jgi:hypothetical protein
MSFIVIRITAAIHRPDLVCVHQAEVLLQSAPSGDNTPFRGGIIEVLKGELCRLCNMNVIVTMMIV